MTGHIRLETDGPVARLVLDHPEHRNATTLAMYAEVPDRCGEIEADPSIRVVVLRGAGDEAFGAGSDIEEFARERTGDDAVAYNAVEDRAVRALAAISRPVVALVHGPCMGGGLGLALAADLRWAADDARFAVPPARLGIGYPPESLAALVRVVGDAAARELILTARPVDADEARAIGLVHRVVAKADLDAEVDRLAEQIAALAPLTLTAAKAVLDDLATTGTVGEAGRARVASCYHSEDYAEGIAAFRERRRPVFRGR